MHLHRLARLSLLLIAAAPLSALGAPAKEAQKHIARAMELHEQNKFDEALVELKTAYAIDPQPDLLFGIGQLYVKVNNCPDAVTYYERFLATTPPPNAAADTQQAIDACKAGTASAVSSRPEWRWTDWNVPPPRPQTASSSPWYADALGGALVVGGAVSLVIGGVLYRTARSDIADANATSSYPRHLELVDDAQTKRTVSVVLFGAGGALVGAGVLRYLLRDRGQERSGIAVVPVDGGGLITWSGGL